MSWDLSTLFDDLVLNPKTIGYEDKVYSLYKWLRENHPHALAKDPSGEVEPFRAISRYKDVMEIEKHPDIFGNYPYFTLTQKTQREEVIKKFGRPIMFPLLLNMDPPEHTIYRKLTQQWFNPGEVKKLTEQVRTVANEHIDKIAQGDTCDFAQDITTWYPLHIIMLILGIPRSDEHLMMRLTQEFMSPEDPDTKGEREQIDPLVAFEAMGAYFGSIVADRQANPKDDLSTIIANAKIDGKDMPLERKVGYMMLIIVAGHDTTKFASSGGMCALLRNPDQLQKLRDNPELMPKAVEEMIRYASPVRYFMRKVRSDYRLGDFELKEGEDLMLLYGSACRDETAIPDADKFDIEREPNRHLAFGHGVHMCLGQHLARLEMNILFEEMLKRFGKIEIDGEPEWLRSIFVSGFKKLPIRYST